MTTRIPPAMPIYCDALPPPTNMAPPEKTMPSMVKARVKPAENARLLMKTLALERLADSSEAVAPEMNER